MNAAKGRFSSKSNRVTLTLRMRCTHEPSSVVMKAGVTTMSGALFWRAISIGTRLCCKACL